MKLDADELLTKEIKKQHNLAMAFNRKSKKHIRLHGQGRPREPVDRKQAS